MTDLTQAAQPVSGVHLAGAIAMMISLISAVGVVAIIAMFILFAVQQKDLGDRVGMINDICVALQYLLTIPVALVLHRILLAYNPSLMRAGTIIGVTSMLVVVILQLLLIFKVLTFEQQGTWATLALILGVGSWLVITGLVARSTGRLPNSLLMSGLAVPYLGSPAWAFWLGLHLLRW